ncbi:MAG: aminotransferase class V-fold PLP-dependent enzyme [Candidatus Hydrogenedentes bacterium]|nr:aminotransferase class V-fold PLP-dependent enzyme [Candidatus Hydrogenedentota bacterium]
MPGIYLDHSATTPVREEVFAAMEPYLRTHFGNPGSIHRFGRETRRTVDDAREQVAALIHADPREIVFTSGGTEADNLALRGTVAACKTKRRKVIVSSVEHHAVLQPAEYLSKTDGIEVRVLGVDAEGLVDVDELASLIDEETALVSVMHANNETGAIQPIEPIASLCAQHGVHFHTDAVQSAGKILLDVRATPVSLLALSGHKLYAPKGVGACYVRKGVDIVAQMLGGFQERERRAGTENVAGIVGFGKACELARREWQPMAARTSRLRDALQAGILERIPDTYVNGPSVKRLPNLLNVGISGVEGESVVLGLDVEKIAVSSGAACTSGSLEPSHVLLAMGQSHARAQSAMRFSLGIGTTEAEIDCVLEVLPPLVERLRAGART